MPYRYNSLPLVHIMLRAAVWILPVKVDMGNCCGWCARYCCCCCCCSRCCKAAIPEDEQLVSEKEPESTVLTVTEDPSGVSETQEMKFIVALPGTELSKRNTGPNGEEKQVSEEEKPAISFRPPQPFVRGGSGRGSWRVVATVKKDEEKGASPAAATDTVHVSFEEAPPPVQREPRNIVLFAHDVDEVAETQVVQSFSFSTAEGIMSDQ